MSDEQLKQMQRALWAIADILRGKMDGDTFKHYMLGFIFYRYLSESIERYINDDLLKDDNVKFSDINPDTDDGAEMLDAIRDEVMDELGYFLEPGELFSSLLKNYKDSESPILLEPLQKALDNISNSTRGSESEEDFRNLFEDLDLESSNLGRSAKDINKVIIGIMEKIGEVDFGSNDANDATSDNAESPADMLGDAYEYLIGKFASGAGKKAGEFYTPRRVSELLAQIITQDNGNVRTVYDPTCGSGSLLIRAVEAIKRKYPDSEPRVFGQEMNRTTYNLARMNMMIHRVHYRNFDIELEDTLKSPQHLEGDDGAVRKFDGIVANPPFSAKWARTESEKVIYRSDPRFAPYDGRLAPSSAADFAFIQHMLYQLSDSGTMAVVAPHGVLFRGAAEGAIRKHIIETYNYLDAVVGLPANLFYGTSIPTCILIFKKCRKHSDNILFIDSSAHFDKKKNQNELSAENIGRILGALANRKSEDKYSHVATLDEVRKNEYNLNIPRYVDTFEPEPIVDLDATAKRLVEIESDIAAVDDVIAEFCDDLGIPFPGIPPSDTMRTGSPDDGVSGGVS